MATCISKIASVVACTTIVAIGSLTTGSQAGAIDNGEWGIAPAATTGGAERTSFEFEAWPAVTISDSVAVSNLTDTPRRFKLYAADAETDGDGAVSVADAASVPRGAGKWITLSPSLQSGEVEIPANSTSLVPFQIAVPSTILPGRYRGGIGAIRLEASSGGGALAITQAVATVVTLNVTATPPPVAIEVEDLNVQANGAILPGSGSTRLQANIRNTGKSPVVATVAVTDDFGAKFGAAQQVNIPPGAAAPIDVSADATPALFGGSVHLTITTPTQTTPIELEKSVSVTPVWLIIVTLLAAGLAAVIFLRRRSLSSPGR